MHFPAKRRSEFVEARIYEYPTHLKSALDDLPASPGVYIFHGHEGELPLYIGKSVNLRSRVLAHLRSVDEARMLRQSVGIRHIRTAGELGSLLLEAQLIKQQQPLHNQKLRRVRQVCAWRMGGAVPEVVFSRDHDFSVSDDLYGMYPSRYAALEQLRALADQHRLCYGALDLEKLARGKPCFRAMLRQCAGVCRGDESQAEHAQRLRDVLDDLRISRWPYPGAIALVERGAGGACDYLVLRGWGFAGRAASLAEAKRLDRTPQAFDADVYKIIRKAVSDGRHEIIFIGDMPA